MALIKRIRVENFKRFSALSIKCEGTNIFIGPNNAGKSTILDALRICRDVHRHAYRRKPVLKDQGQHGVCPTYELTHSQICIPIENVVRNYGDSYATINLEFDNKEELYIKLSPEKQVIAYFKSDKFITNSTSDYKRRFPTDFIVVPTLSALEEREAYVRDDTVTQNEHTRLSSRNFRNIIWRKSPEAFATFSEICKAGWPEIEVERPELHFSHERGRFLTMMFKEHRIPREVYWAGLGFQIWMQMAAQMLRGGAHSVLVIDEPDIYLHPDLQKKLLLYARKIFPQIFIATHSTEIINYAEPGEIISIEPNGSRVRRIATDTDYKQIYTYLGSSENAEFARIARAKRIIFFEGKDRNIIRKFARKLKIAEMFEDPYTVYLQAGGFSQWRRVKEIDWALENVFSLQIKVGALFDRDYWCDDEVIQFQDKISSERLWIGVLNRKEIENYALHPIALRRVISERLSSRNANVSDHEIETIIEEVALSFEEDCRAQRLAKYLTYHKQVNKKLDDSEHMKNAYADFHRRWLGENRFSYLPGKEFIAALSARLQRDYKTSITLNMIIDQMDSDEIDPVLSKDFKSLGNFFIHD